MTDFATEIFTRFETNSLAEVIREIIFPGDGVGCYTDFEVRQPIIRKWTLIERTRFWKSLDNDLEAASECARLGDGYSFFVDPFGINACWFWDGDGTLFFSVNNVLTGKTRKLINHDCKKDYGWEEL